MSPPRPTATGKRWFWTGRRSRSTFWTQLARKTMLPSGTTTSAAGRASSWSSPSRSTSLSLPPWSSGTEKPGLDGITGVTVDGLHNPWPSLLCGAGSRSCGWRRRKTRYHCWWWETSLTWRSAGRSLWRRPEGRLRSGGSSMWRRLPKPEPMWIRCVHRPHCRLL